MTDYSDWKILKTEADEKAEEYTTVANWCNDGQQYHIEDDGTYYKVVHNHIPTEDELKDQVRFIRNEYLRTFVDPVVSNPLRWQEMTEEEQNIYVNYRHYLLDYTETENWWLQNPMTLDEWKEKGV